MRKEHLFCLLGLAVGSAITYLAVRQANSRTSASPPVQIQAENPLATTATPSGSSIPLDQETALKEILEIRRRLNGQQAGSPLKTSQSPSPSNRSPLFSPISSGQDDAEFIEALQRVAEDDVLQDSTPSKSLPDDERECENHYRQTIKDEQADPDTPSFAGQSRKIH